MHFYKNKEQYNATLIN